MSDIAIPSPCCKACTQYRARQSTYSSVFCIHLCHDMPVTCSCGLSCSVCTHSDDDKQHLLCMCKQVWLQVATGWTGKGCRLRLQPPHQPLQPRTRAKRTRSWCHKGRAASWSPGRTGGPLTPATWLFQMSRCACMLLLSKQRKLPDLIEQIGHTHMPRATVSLLIVSIIRQFGTQQ